MNHAQELAEAEARYQAHTAKAQALPPGMVADWEWTLARHAATIIGQLRRQA